MEYLQNRANKRDKKYNQSDRRKNEWGGNPILKHEDLWQKC